MGRLVKFDKFDTKVRRTSNTKNLDELSNSNPNLLLPSYCPKAITALANKPSTLQIFAPSKFGLNQTTGSKVMGKKLFWSQVNFLAITSEPVVRSIRNFEGAKICMVDGLFSNAVQPLSQ